MFQEKRFSDKELFQQIDNAHKILMNSVDELNKRGYGSQLTKLYASHYYQPNSKLTELLTELEIYIKKQKPSDKERQDAGKLMENIAFVVLYGLKGVCINNIKSFQSVGAQYDLLVHEDHLTGESVFSLLGITNNIPKGILIEAKAYAKPIEDKHFSRFCNLIQLNLEHSVGIGIFFTIKGATGFPKRGGKNKRAISDSWFRQVLFYAKTNKPIIVLDAEDILSLDRNGSFIELLKKKIDEIEEL